MYNCISLYVICLYWRIYVCMYHLEYMHIVSAYKYAEKVKVSVVKYLLVFFNRMERNSF
jgi:hypothetical protein